MGYSVDQEGIMTRYINEEGGWDSHLKNSKQYILDFVARKSPEKIGILGSGWLLDVPLEELQAKVNEIFLYDIRHPRQIMHRYRNNKKIHFVQADITGGGIENTFTLLKNSNARPEALLEIPMQGFTPKESIDSVVSLNLLCQLDILILEYLRNFPVFAKSDIIPAFRKKIQESHMQTIANYNACLISDYEELIYDRIDNLIETHQLLFSDFPESKNAKEWIWQFDTQMTYYPNRKTFFKVRALEI